jgi:hypothetical protein
LEFGFLIRRERISAGLQAGVAVVFDGFTETPGGAAATE